MRFRLYPTPEQETALLAYCGHARFVWNLGLEQRLMWRPGRGPTPGYAEQSRQLTEARAAEPWLAEGSSKVQHQALRDLDRAWKDFFAGRSRRPTWRTRGAHESFRVIGERDWRLQQDNGRWSSVLVPKIGMVRFRRTRAIKDAKSYRITRDRSGRWHIAFTIIPEPIPAPGTGEIVGVDRGVAVAAALSTGEKSSPSGLRPKEAERLLRLQRRLARAKKGSTRRHVVKRQIAEIKAREADRRKDWAEKTSTDLARRFDLIRVEDLRVRQMTRAGRGKRGLNRGILAAGWSLLVTRLEQKAPGRVEKVNPAYTSQTCSACGHVSRESRESQSRFRCVSCGHQANADVNAALNIASRTTAAGLAVAARGDMAAMGLSVKREPQLATTA